jgi:hypothetical protein
MRALESVTARMHLLACAPRPYRTLPDPPRAASPVAPRHQAATKKQKYEKISDKKMRTPFESLCKGFPREFVLYFQNVR